MPSVLFIDPDVGPTNAWAVDSTAFVRPLHTADDVAAIDVALAGSISGPNPIASRGPSRAKLLCIPTRGRQIVASGSILTMQ